MFFHCKPYKRNIKRLLAAVFTILLGVAYAFSFEEITTSGKPRIALLGDSMTWIGGDSCQNETGWTHVLKESGLAGAIDVYARSGATWTNTESTRRNPKHYSEILHDDNVVFNQAVRLTERADTSDSSPDIIILFAGANDAWFASKRPGIFDSQPLQPNDLTSHLPSHSTTLEGSIRLVSEILHTRFPEATILFVAPLQMAKTDSNTIHQVSDIIEVTAAKLGWATLRADKETCITHDQESQSPEYTYDGVHTNPSGARILGEYIIGHLLDLKLITENQ